MEVNTSISLGNIKFSINGGSLIRGLVAATCFVTKTVVIMGIAATIRANIDDYFSRRYFFKSKEFVKLNDANDIYVSPSYKWSFDPFLPLRRRLTSEFHFETDGLSPPQNQLAFTTDEKNNQLSWSVKGLQIENMMLERNGCYLATANQQDKTNKIDLSNYSQKNYKALEEKYKDLKKAHVVVLSTGTRGLGSRQVPYELVEYLAKQNKIVVVATTQKCVEMINKIWRHPDCDCSDCDRESPLMDLRNIPHEYNGSKAALLIFNEE